MNCRQVRCVCLQIVALAFIAVGCAHNNSSGKGGAGNSGDPPRWFTTGTHPQYPSEMYVTGQGTGQSRKQAFASGLGEVAVQIKSDIKVKFESKVAERVRTSGDKEKVSRSRDTRQNIRLHSELNTKGLAELVDVYVESDRTYHVFVALSKSSAAEHFKDKYSNRFRDAKSTFDELREAKKSGNIRRIAEVVNKLHGAKKELQNFKVMTRVFGGQVNQKQKKTFEQKYRSALDFQRKVWGQTALRICAKSDTKNEDRLRYLEGSIVDWFSEKGIEVLECRQSIPPAKKYKMKLSLKTELSCSEADEIQKLTTCRGTGVGRLINTGTGQTVLNQSIGGESFRESARQKAQAMRQVQENLAKQFTGHLAGVLGEQPE